MNNIPDGLLYTKDDEWIRVENGEGVIGITDYAQDSLSDIVYVELPDAGDNYSSGDSFGVVESVKAAADLFMPIGGEVLAVNDDLIDAPEVVNDDPYERGWMIRIKIDDPTDLNDLMDPAEYTRYCEERE